MYPHGWGAREDGLVRIKEIISCIRVRKSEILHRRWIP